MCRVGKFTKLMLCYNMLRILYYTHLFLYEHKLYLIILQTLCCMLEVFSKPSGTAYLERSDILPLDKGGWAGSRNPSPGGWLIQYSADVWSWPYCCMSLVHAERSKCLFGGLHAPAHFNVPFHSPYTITKPRSRGSEPPFWLLEWLN